MEFTKEVVRDLVENVVGVQFQVDYDGRFVNYILEPSTLQNLLQNAYDQGYSKGLIEELGNDV